MITGTIAELLTVLGVDSAPLSEGLLNAEMSLNDFAPKVLSSQAALLSLGDEMAATGMKASGLNVAMQALYDQKIANALLDADEQARISFQSQEDNERLMAANQARSAAAAERLATDRAMYAWEQEARIQDLESERIYVAEWKAFAQDQVDAQERMTAYRIELDKAATHFNAGVGSMKMGGSGGGTSSFMAANEIRALEGSQYGIARLLTMLPQVREFMEAAFDGVVVIALLEILYQVGKEIEVLITDWEGFGKAAQEAWSKAEVGADRAMLKQNDYQRKLEEAKGLLSIAPEKGHQYLADKYGIDVAADAHENERLKALQKNIQDNQLGPLENRVNAYDSKYKGANALTSPYLLGLREADAESKTVEQDRKTILDLRKEEEDIASRLGQLDLDKINKQAEYLHQLDEEHDKKVRALKLHDNVHELPYRLPWFMGADPANLFLGLTGNPGAGLGIMGSRTPTAPPLPGMGTGNHISMTFHGMPADLEDFVHEKMIPSLLSALDNNKGGSLSKMSNSLANAGIVSSV